ncbi:MAG: 30S ribosomal protein S1 [Acidobacteria bacterium]|nr:30S ribosomal protein S1 [Acidobacteriota bacterium]
MDQQNNSNMASEGMGSPTEDTSFGDILSRFEQEHHTSRESQALEGTVVAVTPDAVFVDIARKMDGILTVQALEKALDGAELKKGDRLQVMVTGRDTSGQYNLSLIVVERPKDWSALEQAFAGQAIIAATVTESVKGGLRVDVGVPAFLPASRTATRDAAEMEKLVGQEIRVRIIELNTSEENVVVDRKVVLMEEERQAKEQAFLTIQEGTIIRGTVKTLMDFGAFVDIGGFDGLLHVADMAWHRVNKPSDMLKTGDQLEVKILKINRGTHKISLGLKQLSADPWTLVAEKYKAGERIKGTVSRTTDFGAFVELEPGIEGLIHVSEMSWSKKQRKPSEIVKPGEVVEVVVLGVNPTDKRISLGLKQALGDPWEDALQKFPVGAVAEGPVVSLQKFGAFMKLTEGVEGMIHIGDISREKRLEHPSEALKLGQVVRAEVLEVDRERRRIRLGMKQLEPTSADEYIAEHHEGEVVAGRVVDASPSRLKVELGEGVFAQCRLRSEEKSQAKAAREKLDLSSMTAMLTARWKQGTGTQETGGREEIRGGQIRSFRILSMDPAQKKIELELAN